MTVSRFSTPILAKKNLTDQMLEIRFARPADFVFEAGQFVQLLVPNENKGETPRSYSLSSTPTDSYFEFGVKLYDNGVASNYLEKADIGDEVILKGPFGRFINSTPEQIVGIGTGAGLVPIMSIITDELHNKKNQSPLHILFGVRSETDLFWVDRLENLQKQFSNFSYTITLSQPEKTWSGNNGRVTEYVTALNFKAHFFLCGSPEMVKEVRTQLLSNGVQQSGIHLEIF